MYFHPFSFIDYLRLILCAIYQTLQETLVVVGGELLEQNAISKFCCSRALYVTFFHGSLKFKLNKKIMLWINVVCIFFFFFRLRSHG